MNSLPTQPSCPPLLAERLADMPSWISADAPVPSPCINVCKMDDEQQFCIGCLRTLDELRAWRTLDDEGKRAVWRLIEERAA